MAVDVQTDRGFMFGKTSALPIQGIPSGGPGIYDITPDAKSFVIALPKGESESDRAPAEQIHVTLDWFEELKQRVK